ncbi:hypothetical protein F8M41_006979 [Gigaspora margarita]|uniref:Uncharacterized protein n=1 Tax=Gigaspora margarita TaxID=4874 RepID=A0A8H4A4U5_GIGMA|nr:hypothetical protein F8M41_006979 [Gigaspora margarita]
MPFQFCLKIQYKIFVGDQSHNDVSQLQTDKSPEFLSAGDISRMPFEFDIFNEPPEVTSANGDNLQMQANFDESLDLASVFDAQQFQNGFKLTELTNADGHHYEIYPEYVNSVHKTNIHQVPIKNNVYKVSQVHQQLSRLDSILSENQVMKSQMSSSLNDHLNNLYTTLDSYSSYFSQLLGELEELNLHSSRNSNALQDRIDQYLALVPGVASSISQSSGKLIISNKPIFWITSQSLTNEGSNHQTAPTNQDLMPDYYL